MDDQGSSVYDEKISPTSGDGRCLKGDLLVAGESSSSPVASSAIGLYEDFAAEIDRLSRSMKSPDEILKPGNVIRFARGNLVLPDNMHNCVWVHKEYSKIASEIESQVAKVRSFHLVGSPGTGKSTFGVVWLMFLALKKQKILYRSKDKTWLLYDFSCNSSTTRCFKSYLKAGRFVDNLVWLIVDGASKPVLHPGPVLQCVSDAPESYMEFAGGCGKLLFMEPWDWEDCELCSRELRLDIHDLELRFFFAGGIPRYLFNHSAYTLGDLRSMVDNAAGLVEHLEKLPFYRGIHRGFSLVHYRYLKHKREPCMGTTTTKVCVPGSEYAKEVILQRLSESSNARSNFLERLRGIPSAECLREAVFERVAHEQISQGGCFLMKSLGDKAKSDEFRKSILPQRAVCKYDDQKAGLSYLYADLLTTRSQIHLKDKLPLHFLGWEHYVKPVTKPEGALSSFMTPGRASTGMIFQVSASIKSPIKFKYVQETIDFLDGWCKKQGRTPPPKYSFVFVMLEDFFPVFCKQEFLPGSLAEIQTEKAERIQQFALMLKV